MPVFTHVLVVGAGSWGTALANLLAAKGVATTIWAREPDVVASINTRRENSMFLPGIRLHESLRAVADLSLAISEFPVIVNAVPTQFIRTTYEPLRERVASQLLVTVSKGIEVGTLLTPSEIFAEVVPDAAAAITALSGPSFAREVAVEHPTAVVAASRSADNSRLVRDLCATPRFRVYSSDDVLSVELGGALKNVIAIAAGIVEGLRYGSNTMAALITRGLAEITRLGVARGGNPLTFAGLSGMGDLVLTCTGALSRNRTVGVQLGRGKKLDEIVGEMNMVAEGVKTTQAVHALAQQLGVEMPIADQVYAVLYEAKEPEAVATELMTRRLRDEREIDGR
ncbi:MAG TPA: NAD(P)H-dependent glycerol-3-phosphate dehydrogenase [Acidimicrobiia bacterium]|nr:NAD(P)H-dependent glycerol-3-phosphate dehydrogenase [Acidimicrobiia bacterium]